MHRQGQTYLLGLCEGNRCQGGAAGRVPGGGRIHVFQRGRHHWDRVAKIRLPETVLFVDYSGIAVNGDRIAVVSQVSSALWVGNLAPSGWQVTRRRHELRAPERRRRRHPLRDGRGSVMDSTGPGGHGLGQGQARAGPPLPGQGSVDPHLPYPCPGPAPGRRIRLAAVRQIRIAQPCAEIRASHCHPAPRASSSSARHWWCPASAKTAVRRRRAAAGLRPGGSPA